MGNKYVTPPTFDIAESFAYSNCLCPLIFILSPGADPIASLMTFSRKLGKNLQSISLGQGQVQNENYNHSGCDIFTFHQ